MHRKIGNNAPMQEYRIVDTSDCRQGTEPFPIFPVGAKRVAPFRKAGRLCGIRLSFAPVSSIVGEAGVIVIADVTQIPKDIHRLMISHEDDDAASLPLRLSLKRHQQIHNFASLGSAIEEIASLYENCAPARPASAGVDQLCALEDSDECVQITMHVGDCDNSFSRSDRSDT